MTVQAHVDVSGCEPLRERRCGGLRVDLRMDGPDTLPARPSVTSSRRERGLRLWEGPEGHRDQEGADADAPGADIEPAVAGEGCRRSDLRPSGPAAMPRLPAIAVPPMTVPIIRSGKFSRAMNGVKRHDAGIDEAEQRRHARRTRRARSRRRRRARRRPEPAAPRPECAWRRSGRRGCRRRRGRPCPRVLPRCRSRRRQSSGCRR